MTRKGLTAAGAGLLALAACGERPAEPALVRLDGAQQPDKLHAVAIDRIEVVGGGGVFTADRDGKVMRIPFPLPTSKIDATELHLGERLGEHQDVVVMLDEYGSREPANRRDCAEGVEAFVRVFSLSAGRELMAATAASCLDRIAAPTPSVTWLGDGRFRMEATPKRTFAIIGPDRVEEVERDQHAPG